MSITGRYPQNIVLEFAMPNQEMYEQLFTGFAGFRVRITVPQRGTLCQFVQLSRNNANEELAIRFNRTGREVQALEELGLRDEFILATKCRALTKAEMEAELAASLKTCALITLTCTSSTTPARKTWIKSWPPAAPWKPAGSQGQGRCGAHWHYRPPEPDV